MNQTALAQYDLDIQRLRQVLPTVPGVYCFKDGYGRIIYVGKAKNLKKRVLSYFKTREDQAAKTAMMMKKAKGIDLIVTSTEKEAFILESSLIKKNLPKYNVILRDDKQYPCLRLNMSEDYPRLSVVRKIKKDGAVYFGPFSNAGAVRSTLRSIDRVFKLRKCKGPGLPKRSRPCLNFQMGRCLGVCTQEVSVSEYRDTVEQVRLFLEGRNMELAARLKNDMAIAAEELEFEKAAGIRDQIEALKKTVERQHVVSRRLEDQDVIGLAGERGRAQLVVFFVRKGYIVGSRNFFFNDPGESLSGIGEAFIKQYYSMDTFIPAQILISEPIEDVAPIADWIGELADRKVVIHKPVRGEKLRLVEMAVSNAQALLAGRSKMEEKDITGLVRVHLNLGKAPRIIEGMDISNTYGESAVGAIVRFVDGLPHKAGYRNFRINHIDTINDYGMMAELVEKRVLMGDFPDLFLVDGGRGHLSTVKGILESLLPAETVDVASIAKPDTTRGEKSDKIYVPGRKNPITLRGDSPVLLLMMRIRDEAHRRAISYHRKLRRQAMSESELDRIPGIGQKRRKELLRYFGDIHAVARASHKELCNVPGINGPLADKIQAFWGNRQNAREQESS